MKPQLLLIKTNEKIKKFRQSRSSKNRPFPKEIKSAIEKLASKLPHSVVCKELNLSPTLVGKVKKMAYKKSTLPKPQVDFIELPQVKENIVEETHPIFEICLQNGAKVRIFL